MNRNDRKNCSVLAALWVAAIALTIIAFFAIVFTGKYPKRLFNFVVGVTRWTWRVGLWKAPLQEGEIERAKEYAREIAIRLKEGKAALGGNVTLPTSQWSPKN